MDPLQTPPETSSFVLLADHQSRTPASFHSGPPVLHYHSKQCQLVAYEHDLLSVPALNAIRSGSQEVSQADSNGVDNPDEGKEVVINGVDVWVTSDKFLLYTPATSKGISISYPSISLHAIQRLQPPGSSDQVQGLYMQIASPASSASASRDDDEEDSITITIVPTAPEVPASAPASDDQPEAEGEAQAEAQEETVSPTQMFYNAVSACSNLHPDPVLPGDEDDDDDEDEEYGDAEGAEAGYDAAVQGGLPPPMPGSSGWITADNMHEFFDEDGNWIAGGQEPSFPLGPGAGTVRQRDEGDTDTHGDGGAGDTGDATDETKWQRTD